MIGLGLTWGSEDIIDLSYYLIIYIIITEILRYRFKPIVHCPTLHTKLIWIVKQPDIWNIKMRNLFQSGNLWDKENLIKQDSIGYVLYMLI